MRYSCGKLSPVSLGLAIGILWAAANIIVGLLGTWYDYGHGYILLMGSVYPMYTNTVIGSLIGGLWSLVDGFISGAILALLYNCFSCRCSCSCTPCAKDEPFEKPEVKI